MMPMEMRSAVIRDAPVMILLDANVGAFKLFEMLSDAGSVTKRPSERLKNYKPEGRPQISPQFVLDFENVYTAGQA